MKINYALILAASLSSGLMVQPVFSDEQPAPPAPAPAVPMPAAPGISEPKPETPAAPLIPAPKAPAKKSAAIAKKAPVKAAQPLTPAEPIKPGPAVARQDNVNVRGQAAMNSEVVTRLKKGQEVTVLEEITKKPKQDEPSKWAKITLPGNTVVWVHSSFIDPATKTVKPKKLNLRSGPGENYSVVGLLEKGAAVKELETKGDWIKIETPAGAYGFVASHLLQSAPAAPAIASVEPSPPVTPIAPPPDLAMVTPIPAPPATPPETTPAAPIPAPVPAIEEGEKEEPLIKRVITREGIVKRSASIQAPAYFVLQSLHTAKTVNYLHSTNLVLKDFWNQRVLVTGEEQLDERWPNTPVIYVESLQPVQ